MNLSLISITAHVLLVGRGTELKRQNGARKHGERRKGQKEIIAFKDHTRSRKRKMKFQTIRTSSVKTAVHCPKQGHQGSTNTLIGLKVYSSHPRTEERLA